MPNLTLERLQEYRAETYGTAPGLHVTRRKTIAFVDERGFAFFGRSKK